jgi:hypothetical protein
LDLLLEIAKMIGLASPDGQELLHTFNENCPLWFHQQLRRRLEALLTGWISKWNDADTAWQCSTWGAPKRFRNCPFYRILWRIAMIQQARC